MTKKQSLNSDMDEIAKAGTAHSWMDDYDPDESDEVFAVDIKREREWYESRGYEVPEQYLEGYDPHDRYEHLDDWVEKKEFNPVKVISPKNANYPE